MSSDALTIQLRLVKAGYGSLNEVKKMETREIIQALNYEGFLDDYERAYIELNKSQP